MGIKEILKENLPPLMLESLKRAYSDAHYVAMHVVPEAWYLKRQFKKKVGYPLNLDNPRTFNEKLQWLKLHDRNPLYTKMVDKYEAKKYVAEIIGDEYIIPTLGVWNHFDEIDFDQLPEQFVLKCTHDSGSIVICKNKRVLDKKLAKQKVEHALRYNYYYSGFEWPYKNVKPRIIAEPYLIDGKSNDLMDYKFFSFNGKTDCVMLCFGRSSGKTKFVFFDKDWNVKKYNSPTEKSIAYAKNIRPDDYERMFSFSEILSKDIPFVRVDFYYVNGKIYFGEITFFPDSGFDGNILPKSDKRFGDMIQLGDVQ